jgi:hypothetical protein
MLTTHFHLESLFTNAWGSARVQRCIQKFSESVDNEINNNKHSLRSNTKGYGGKTHWTYSQNSDTTASSGRELYHLQFSVQTASPETFGYTLVCITSELVQSQYYYYYHLNTTD